MALRAYLSRICSNAQAKPCAVLGKPAASLKPEELTLAGMLAAPLTTVYPGMGEGVLVLSFVVVVIGGIGSIKGAFLGALLVGLSDTFGKMLLPGFSSAMVYAVMAAVLLFRPRGLLGQAA